MKLKNKYLILSILLIFITITIIFIIFLNYNKETYVLCTATEKKDVTTIITTKYNFNKEKTKIENIDYIIEISGIINEQKINVSKQFFENTICNKDKQPINISCDIETYKNKIIVKTHEKINDNKSLLLGLNNLDKLNYDNLKNNQNKNTKCKYK